MKTLHKPGLIVFLTTPFCGLGLWAVAQVSAADKPTVETTTGWVKSPKNPVLGGDFGTCSVLRKSASGSRV
jgi:hypothetical protein